MSLRLDELKRELRELQARGDDGDDAGGVAARRAELQRLIVEQVMQEEAQAAVAAPRPPARLVAGVAAFVLAFGVAGYAWLGHPQAASVGPGEAVAAAAPDGAASDALPDAAQIEAMVAKLAERMKDRPDDAEGWTMLGRSYAVLGQNDKALGPFKRVFELKPNDASAMVDYADALGMAQGGTLDGEPARLIEAALKLEPKNLKVLYLAGTVAFNRSEFARAASLWETAVGVAEPGSEVARNLQNAIAEARSRGGLPAAAAAQAAAGGAGGAGNAAVAGSAGNAVGATGTTGTTGTTAAAAAAHVAGRVTLAPALAARAAPEDTLYVFARPAQGGRMPLAILKKQVKDLPLDFRLDDSHSMSPAARLSGAAEVVVGARISKSGNPMPQPGDLEGLSAAVKVGSDGLRIEIADIVK